MRKIAAIAALTIRSAIRSRVIAVAAAAIIAVIIGLPFVIKGDGTPESQSIIFINYSFGLLMFVLSLTATWCGAGAISLEIGERQIQLLITKPLRSVQIWAGKLLGLMTVNLVLLALGGALISAMIHWTLGTAETNKTGQNDLRRKIMTVYRAVPPLKASGLQSSQAAISPGQSFSWRFELTKRTTGAQFALLKFRFIPSPFSHQTPVAGVWRAATEKQADLLNKTLSNSPNMTVYLNIPKIDPAGILKLEYQNIQTNPAVTVFFPSGNDLSLLIPESSFEANLLRGLIIGFARLAFFTSLGMIAGTLFTFPVAVFASLGLLAMAFSGGFVRQLAERGLSTDTSCEQFSIIAFMLNDMVRVSFRFFAFVLSPLERFDPLAFLPDSLFIPWSLTGQSFAVLCCLYPLILLLIGAGCLRRREVGISSV